MYWIVSLLYSRDDLVVLLKQDEESVFPKEIIYGYSSAVMHYWIKRNYFNILNIFFILH